MSDRKQSFNKADVAARVMSKLRGFDKIQHQLLGDNLKKRQSLAPPPPEASAGATNRTNTDFYNLMHQISTKANSRVASGKPQDALLSNQGSSRPRFSSLSTKLVPDSDVYILPSIQRVMRPTPSYLDRSHFGSQQARTLKGSALRLVDSSKDIGSSTNVAAIVMYRNQIILMKQAINYMTAPPTSVKVQWRVSRYLLAPGFYLLYTMLSRYGSVIALIKLTPNSAICVFNSIHEAAGAITNHALNQSFKLLILSWWYPLFDRTDPFMMHEPLGSIWLMSVSEGLEKNADPFFYIQMENNKIGKNKLMKKYFRTRRIPSYLGTVPQSLKAAKESTKMKLIENIKRFYPCADDVFNDAA